MPDTGWRSFFDVYDWLYHEARRWNRDVTDDRPRCAEHKTLLRWQQLDTSKGPTPTSGATAAVDPPAATSAIARVQTCAWLEIRRPHPTSGTVAWSSVASP